MRADCMLLHCVCGSTQSEPDNVGQANCKYFPIILSSSLPTAVAVSFAKCHSALQRTGRQPVTTAGATAQTISRDARNRAFLRGPDQLQKALSRIACMFAQHRAFHGRVNRPITKLLTYHNNSQFHIDYYPRIDGGFAFYA